MMNLHLYIHTIFQAAPTAVLAVIEDDQAVRVYSHTQTTTAEWNGISWVVGEWVTTDWKPNLQQIREQGKGYGNYYLSRLDEDWVYQCIGCGRPAEFVAGCKMFGHRHWCSKCHYDDMRWFAKFNNRNSA